MEELSSVLNVNKIMDTLSFVEELVRKKLKEGNLDDESVSFCERIIEALWEWRE